MNTLLEHLSRVLSGWKFWVVVAPWDVGVRVRLGRKAIALAPGLHLRIPGVDEITLVNTRLRIVGTPTQTIPSSTPNKTRTVSASVGFRIVDPLRALMTYTEPMAAVAAFVQASIAEEGALRQKECLLALRKEFSPSGVEVLFVYANENVEVRTYRLISGGGGSMWSGPSPAPLGQPHQAY